MGRVFKPFLFLGLPLSRVALAAFTVPTSYEENTVQTNDKGVWCYFPAAGQTTSDNTRYGGAEWSVPVTNAGKVTLCVSGRAEDGTYQTACMFVTADNSLPIPGGCWVDVAQSTVTDGCYVPEQLAVSTPPISSAPPTSSSTSSTSTEPSTSTSLASMDVPTSSRSPPTTHKTSTTLAATSSTLPTASSQTSGKGGLDHNDIIAIVFGVISTVGVVASIWWIWKQCS